MDIVVDSKLESVSFFINSSLFSSSSLSPPLIFVSRRRKGEKDWIRSPFFLRWERSTAVSETGNIDRWLNTEAGNFGFRPVVVVVVISLRDGSAKFRDLDL